MKAKDLYRAIGQIDDDLIDNAATAGRKSTAQPWVKWAGLAACCVLVVSAALMLPRLVASDPGDDTQQSQPTTQSASLENPAERAAVTYEIDQTPVAYDFGQTALMTADLGFEASTLSVTATSYQGSSISTDSSFVLSANGLTEDLVREYVNIIPDVEYVLSTDGDGNIMLTPQTPIDQNAIVNIELTDSNGNTLKKWAFQTADVFTLVSTYPAQDDTVDTDSGIEFRFSSDTVDITSVESAFSIQPQVKGEFELRGKTAIFVPSDGLEAGTVYTVSLDSTAADSDGVTIDEGVSFGFYVDNRDENLFGYSEGELNTFTDHEIPIISTPAGYDYTDLPVDVEIYTYSAFADFTADIQSSGSLGFVPDFDSMTKVTEFEAQQLPVSGFSSDSYCIEFPDTLENGFYAVRYSMETGDGISDSSFGFIQISPLVVYAAASDDQILVWVNDSATDSVVPGADISVAQNGQTVTAVTDSMGSAVIDLPSVESGGECIVTIDADGQYYAAPCYTGYNRSGSTVCENYYSYVYTSREIYLPTDTVKMWGYIAPRRDVELPDTVTVSFSSYDGEPLSQVEAKVNGGCFTAECALEDWGLSYLYVNVYINQEMCATKYVNVTEFEKPLYIMSAETDQEIYFADEIESVGVSVETTFFDSTPAANMKLSYSADYGEEKVSTRCDENGRADFAVSYSRSDGTNWTPSSPRISINTDELDSVDTYIYLNPILFYHDIMLQTEVDDGAVAISANYIDLGDITTRQQLYSDNYPENIRGEGYDCTVTISGTERYWQKVEAGQYYDFVYKKTVQSYNYELVETSIGPWEVRVVDGKAVFDDIQLLDDRSYSLDISTQDSDGYTVSTSVYYSGWLYGSGNLDDGVSLRFTAKDMDYTVNYGDGEDVLVEIYNSETPFTSQSGYFISFMQQESLYDVQLSTGSSITVDFDETNLPNAGIVGAYYSGGKLYTISKLQLIFQPEKRELKIDIIPDSDQYAPGDDASVTLRVTDSDGNPVSGAQVLVSVSDESVFAIIDQSAEFLTNFYAYRDWGYISVYGGTGDLMAEMGGGDGMEFRDDFANDLNFDCLTTDSNGQAVTTITLADNLTSWRITALAARGKYVGDSKTNISATLPMFLSPVVADTFITGDDISFGCRTYGVQVDSGDKVSYSAWIESADGGKPVDIISISCAAGENASFNFGKLEKGSYTFYISGACGQLSDAVAMDFEVVDTAAEIWGIKEVSGSEVNDLDVVKYPVTITVTNGAYKTYNKALNAIRYSGSVRTDEKAAQNIAAAIIARQTGDDSCLDTAPSMRDISTKYGLLCELEAGSGDVYFTARLAASSADMLNKDLIYSFQDIIDDESVSTEELTSAYLGLAAFNQPVLNDIRQLEAQNRDVLDDYDLLRLAQALALLGDSDNALRLYNELVTPRLSTLTVGDDTVYVRCHMGGMEEANVEYTALALAVASILQLDDADDLASYVVYARQTLSHNENSQFYPLCELMTYVSYYCPRGGQQVTVSYVKNGKTETVTVGERGMAVLEFNTKSQYDQANISLVSGEACMVASYMLDVSTIADQKSSGLTVEKSMSSSGKLGEDMTVTLTVTAAEPGTVYIQDYIPSGFRLADSASYMDGQTVRFYKLVEGTVTITYKIKPVVSGSFVVEMPVAARVDNGLMVTGQRSEVETTK